MSLSDNNQTDIIEAFNSTGVSLTFLASGYQGEVGG